MSRSVTIDLIRRRTEHHEGLLRELVEIDLHQDSLTALGPILGRTCLNLRRLYLHNNVISSIGASDWSKLTNLRFVCLALNNLTELEHLDHCCPLMEHLDVSFNLITFQFLETSIHLLHGLQHLTVLHLLGNPCEREWSNCRPYVIARLPQLKRLDGKEILPGERDSAQRNLESLQEELDALKQANEASGTTTVRETREQLNEEWVQLQKRMDQDRKQSLFADNQPQIIPDQKTRIRQVREQELQGERRNVNEGNWKYTLQYETKRLLLTVDIPKEVPSEDVDVDLKSDFVSIVIQGEVLRLRLQHLIDDENAVAQRSQASGKLQLNLPLRQEIVLEQDKLASTEDNSKEPDKKVSLAAEMQNVHIGSELTDSDDDEPPPLY